MKPTRSTLNWLVILGWSIFMGITVVSIGIGSLFPQLTSIAGPFVCPHGQIEVTSHPYRVSPVESGYTLTYYCVDKQTGAQTELAFLPKHLIAGSIYGLLIFVALLAGWYYYNRYSSKHRRETEKVTNRIVVGFVVVLVASIILCNLITLIRSTVPAPTPTLSAPDATATSIANTFHSLSEDILIAFRSTAKPLANWRGIPIMPQATAGQRINDTTYAFRVSETSETIESFYTDTLKSQGWNLEESQSMAMEFAKDKNTVMVSIAILDDPGCTTPFSPGETPPPALYLGCYIVTLVIVP